MEEDDDDMMNCSYEADNPEEMSVSSVDLSVVEEDLTCLDDSVFSSNASSIAPDDSFSTPLQKDAGPGPTCSSTPKKGRRKSSRKTKSTRKGKDTETAVNENNNVVDPVFKKPALPPAEYFARCPDCGQYLKTEKGFRNHTLNHKWKKLATKVPPQDQIRDHCDKESKNIVLQIKNFEWPGENGKELRALAATVEEKMFSKEWEVLFTVMRDIVVKGFSGFDINKRSMTFPATSRQHLIVHINKSLGDSDIRCYLFESLQSITECSPEIAFPFLFDFIRKLGNSALAFYFRTLSGRDSTGDGRRKRSRDDFNHQVTHQVIHYIAGSCMKSIIRHSYTYYKCEKLQRRRLCILKKFSRPDGAPIAVVQPRHHSYWTQLLNRKSLIFVNDKALPFFIELAKLLQSMEKADGSLGHVEVMERVVNSPPFLLKWSNIVECDLSEDESFQLMVKTIRIITNTFGRGVLLRRMNKRFRKGKGNKATVAISHRARLLTNNNK